MEKVKKVDGIVLYSGGLDSLLSAKILMEQGLNILGLHCILPFMPENIDVSQLESTKLAEQINFNLKFHFCGNDYIQMLKNPPHGYGKNINPCIDCPIYFIKKAVELMNELDASFIATGEVVGQRPMSQLKHTLQHIVKTTGLEGRLLRPLSAKILKPTIVEENGMVNRELLFGISGRGRSQQIEMADKFGIKYKSPGGGCLFTDPNVSARLKKMFSSSANVSSADIYLTSVGRHFMLPNSNRIIVGRFEAENNILSDYRKYGALFFSPEFAGPSVLAFGNLTEDDKEFCSSVIIHYGKCDMCDINKNKINVYKNDLLVEVVEISEKIEKIGGIEAIKAKNSVINSKINEYIIKK
jgi:tRNA U34 2-thiouridine synthase MnmA/TrmU